MHNTTLGKQIAIVGPTASGKSELALYLAERFDGEIVCADSRTIYRGLDIGTAKPSVEDQKRVPHHLLDVIEPDEQMSAAEFKRLAEGAIADIKARGKVPFLVGGSGLYVDSVLFDYQFPAEADTELREKLERMGDEELIELLMGADPTAFETVDLKNRRRVIRAVETVGQGRGKRERVQPGWLVLGKALSKNVAQNTIAGRVDKILAEGFLNEVERIGLEYGWDSPAMNIIGYRAMKGVVLEQKTGLEGRQDFIRGDMDLFKKQLTWFKRNDEIMWVNDAGEAQAKVQEFLGRAV